MDKASSADELAPGPRGDEVRACVGRLFADPLGERRRCHDKYGHLFALRVGPFTSFFLTHPSHIKHVLQDNAANYGKRTPSSDLANSYMPDGLITSDGDAWRRMRRLSRPAFHRRTLGALVEIMHEEACNTVESWSACATHGAQINVHRDISEATLRVVGRSMLGTDRLGASMRSFLAAFNTVLDSAPRSEVSAWARRQGAVGGEGQDEYAARHQTFTEAMRVLETSILTIICERRHAAPKPDLLSMLMDARDEQGRAFSDAELCGQINTLTFAGHETTANALAFALYLLAKHPAAAERLRQEAEQALAGPGMTIDTLSRMRVAEATLRESMRLYPPVWGMQRRAGAPDRLGRYRVPAGSLVSISQFITHRHPAFWPDPLAFRPERFLSGAGVPRPYAFFPFGGGPRTCIGANMAMAEGTLFLAMIAKHFSLQCPADYTPELLPRIALRPKDGITLTVSRR